MIIPNPVLTQFYLSKEEKQFFKQACFKADTTMSRELRRFVRGFIDNPPTSDRLYYSDWRKPAEEVLVPLDPSDD